MHLLVLTGMVMSLSHAEPAAADDKPAQEANDPYPEAFRKRVDEAVDKGVDFLFARQRADGSWATASRLLEKGHELGVTALGTLACLAGGVRGDDRRIERAFAWLRKQELRKVYDVSVLMMALHARYSGPTKDAKLDRYGKLRTQDPCTSHMSKADKAWMQRCIDFLLEHQAGGHWRYPEDGLDLSNTQYALLGLWAASRCGFDIPDRVWFDSLSWLLTWQEKTGLPVQLQINEVRGRYRITWKEKAKARGFRYRQENPVTGSMTSAGLAGIAICQDELWSSRRFKAPLRKRTRRAIRDALAWLQKHFDVTKNPGEVGGGWHYYYLYGLERAGVIARQRFVGKHDWYLEGATWLLDKQRTDGSWTREDTLIDSAFAILFLKRSTRRTRSPVITPR